MAQSKSELFDDSLIEQANYFKVLSHPARLQILMFLATSSSCITGDISDELPLSRTTVNQHIKELKEIGLIHGHTEGVTTKYCLNPDNIEQLKRVLGCFLKSLDIKNYTCK